MMKAIVMTKHGSPDGLQLQELVKPVPRANEVLIRIHAATVTRGDIMLRKLHPLLFLPLRLFGVRRKRIPGHELAGVIEAIGKDVERFVVGDQVFGTTTGLSVGANAEYVCLPEEGSKGVLALKPANVTFEEAAAAPVGSMTALQILHKGNIQPGQHVLIYGASGSVGSFAVQIAKYYGAEVTGVCSTANVEWVQTLGADQVIDYKKEDFTTNGQTYNVIFDAVGKISSAHSQNSLKEKGVFLSIQASTRETNADLVFLKGVMEAGKLRPMIDRCYPLEQVAEAHRYVEQGHKRGNVVITINGQKA